MSKIFSNKFPSDNQCKISNLSYNNTCLSNNKKLNYLNNKKKNNPNKFNNKNLQFLKKML